MSAVEGARRKIKEIEGRVRAMLDGIPSLDILLRGVCAIMAAALIATFAMQAVSAFMSQRAALRAHEEADITRDLFAAMNNLRIERGTVHTALWLSPPDKSDTQASEIATLRARAKESLDRGVAKLKADGFFDSDRTLENLQNLRAAYDAMRKRVDSSLALPIARRDPKQSGRWIAANDALVNAIDDISERLPTQGYQSDPAINTMMEVKRLAWLTSDAGGMDRLILARAIVSGKKLEPVRRQQIEKQSGRIVSPWRIVTDMERVGKTPPPLSFAIDDAQRIYFTLMCKKRIAILGALTDGKRSPYSEREWLEISKEGLDSLVNVAYVAVDLAENYASADAADASRTFYMSIAAVVLFFGFGVFSVLFVSRRVAEPIRVIATQMRAVANGDLEQSVPFLSRRDEIGQLAAALEVFRANALDKRRIEGELISSKELAEESSRAKSNFLANMSHELRTPLNAVIGFAEILEQETFGPLGSSRYQEYAAAIRGSGTHLLGLINDVLDLSRLDAGRADLVEEGIDVVHLAATALTMVEQQAFKSNIRLENAVPEELPILQADARRVRQVLLNLLSNAIKFTPPGGVVRLGAARTKSGDLAIMVSDTGIGIAEEDIAIVLERFGQADSRLKRKSEGAGLGLPLAKQLVELHGGSLTLESAPEIGTTVTVIFPRERLMDAMDVAAA